MTNSPDAIREAKSKITKYHSDAGAIYRERFGELLWAVPGVVSLGWEVLKTFDNPTVMLKLLAAPSIDTAITVLAGIWTVFWGMVIKESSDFITRQSDLAQNLQKEVDVIELRLEPHNNK